ncbi:DUF1003 domain-containing protein [Calothrix sp. PCC 7507]|uniref:DUF1003 domain-containing protein n=1 Tax=Calothrix sp. PCC 7507 TaxID=99598 RepID=UPI00029F38A6|nr:DUF1003 domain-containing protein [Calothrix sp. PCC 7507]AFY35946.1 protein of unknown function DUF1003 [Calothrix sp. PCC 7507]
MNPLKTVLASRVDAKVAQKPLVAIQTTTDELTSGQRLADKLANQVGSWKFLICQSTILAGWVGINLMPGVPHWDESPFMMLNLVFSFASAYTAPVVLMSQNRQSDTDRRNAEIDHLVNLRSGQNIELLHEKLDELHAQQLTELTQIVKEQQRVLHELRVSLVPVSKENKELKVSLLPGMNLTTSSQLPREVTANKHVKTEQPIGDNSKVIDKIMRR